MALQFPKDKVLCVSVPEAFRNLLSNSGVLKEDGGFLKHLRTASLALGNVTPTMVENLFASAKVVDEFTVTFEKQEYTQDDKLLIEAIRESAGPELDFSFVNPSPSSKTIATSSTGAANMAVVTLALIGFGITVFVVKR